MAKDTKLPFPFAFDVEEGKTYKWCGCAMTTTHPFCDQKHSCEKLVTYKAELTETVYFCGCGQTADPPLCDGSHAHLLLKLAKNKSRS